MRSFEGKRWLTVDHLSGIVDDALVVVVRAMGEVHAY